MPHEEDFPEFGHPSNPVQPIVSPPPPAGFGRMIPPKGFLAERYPLRHRLPFSAGLTSALEAGNTVYFPIVMSSNEMDVAPNTIQVNPHNANYEEDGGPLVRQMSIIDKMRISLKFNMTEQCNDLQETSSGTFTGDGIYAIRCLWRPIFGSFPEKLNSVDEESTLTAAAMLGLTVDSTFEDVIPITTAKLSVTGVSDLPLPVSTVNAVQVFGDFNMTTNLTMEDHVFDEDILHKSLRMATNKGALRSLIGRTRHLTLTRDRPYQSFFLDKFVPRAIRRVVPFSFLGIQVHIPFVSDVEQNYYARVPAGTAQVGVKCLAQYHEWNNEHDMDVSA